jgi:LDH2 family malate/lactate/ureidoglycolate dehydrogenase
VRLQDQSLRHFNAASLKRWVAAVFVACDVAQADADVAAQVLVRTSLRGIDTHGIARIPAYLEKLKTGEVNPRAQPCCELRQGVLHIDGDGGLGQVVAVAAVREVVALARQTALVSCVLRNSGHLAALGLFALEAAEQGMLALLCQRTPPVMALPGSKGPAIGNNPIAFALPVAGAAPLVFDMASSVVARGHVMQALREGRDSIPIDWAIGPDGAPTTDPAQALLGAMRPLTGHKGIGLAMLVECLAGSLSGMAATDPQSDALPTTGSAGNASAFLLVINPELFVGRAAFDAHVKGWLQTYLQASGTLARYPGQRQARCEQQRLTAGIPIAAGLLAELSAAADAAGVPFPRPTASL